MKAGFTLIELLVSIAIFIIITSVAVWNNSQFNSTILLTDLGYEIALSVRQAQVYGITVKAPASCISSSNCPASLSGGFGSGYGIDFDMNSSTSYILFEDGKTGAAPDHIYQPSEQLENFAIGRGYSIARICVPGISSHISTLAVSFIRPEPEAFVSINGATASSNQEADIFVTDPQSIAQREIVIEPTGQISVKLAMAPCN